MNNQGEMNNQALIRQMFMQIKILFPHSGQLDSHKQGSYTGTLSNNCCTVFEHRGSI